MANAQPIPDHVKRQAMSAVGHSEVAAMMRRMNARYAERPFEPVTGDASEAPRPLDAETKRKALSAVDHPEVKAHVRMLEETGSVRPPHTPSLRSRSVGAHINAMYRSGRDADAMHQKVTQNHFGREYV